MHASTCVNSALAAQINALLLTIIPGVSTNARTAETRVNNTINADRALAADGLIDRALMLL